MRRLVSSARWSVLLVLALVVVEIVGPTGTYAVQVWTAVADKALVTAGVPTVVKVTVTNTSTGTGGGEAINCVKLAIPSGFSVTSASISSVSRGLNWSASTSGGTVTLHGVTSSDRLAGLPLFDTLVAAIAVVPVTPGIYAWTADEFAQRDCSGAYVSPISMPITITGSILPTPTPTPSPTLKPTPTSTPTATPTPTPTPTSTPSPSAAGTQPPTGSPGPPPSESITPRPTDPIAPSPSGSDPAAGASPAPTGAPNRSQAPTPGPSPSPGTDASAAGGLSVPGGGGGSGGSDGSMTDVSGNLAAAALDRLGMGTWLVPSLPFAVSGLLVLLTVLIQVGGGLLWLPLIGRRIGGSDGRRLSDRRRGSMSSSVRPARH